MKYKLRSMIVAPPGKTLVMCDLSQAESWIVAFKSGDSQMKYNLMCSDIHTETAAAIHNVPKSSVTKDQRYTGKRVNHASAYRMSPERFAQVYNKDSPDSISIKTAKQYNAAWHELYPNIKQWWVEIEEKLNRNRTLVTVYGRKRMFFQAWGQELFKEATAFEPQSTVADHFNGAYQKEAGVEGGLLYFYKKWIKDNDKGIQIINQSHDSAMVECPVELADDVSLKLARSLHRPIIINGEECVIPVDCEVGPRWGEMKHVFSLKKYNGEPEYAKVA